MIEKAGIQALSVFRERKLLEKLQAIEPTVSGVSAEFIHFIDEVAVLDASDTKVVEKLLTYGQPYSGNRGGQQYVVIPRPGTISPWSSKATDIAHNARLERVRRIERGVIYYVQSEKTIDGERIVSLIADKMTEKLIDKKADAALLFAAYKPGELKLVDILGDKDKLNAANSELGLALSNEEIDYLFTSYTDLNRNPTDVELMMFAQVNSEHCRHKVFNAEWTIDGTRQDKSLFKMIKNTYEKNNDGILSAYSDNAAVISGSVGGRFFADAETGTYSLHEEPIHSVIKVETHNHPTAIAPYQGAATGVGGEIRDEGATGRGAKPKMGLSGYSVSNLQIPDYIQPWENDYGKPNRIMSALDIMQQAPIGAAAFSNEFGRPNVVGYFRTFEQEVSGDVRGYHKPIMLAGGLGDIREGHIQKNSLSDKDVLVVLGGPSMLIGLGGGAASSMQSGESSESLDFASVQRANAEMERRVQQVIDHCWAMGENNPIISIHDVGAGGLSNALPELVHDSGLGAKIELRDTPSAEAGLSPLEIWCNESQERYVLGLNPKSLQLLKKICARERCPYAAVGAATQKNQLVLHDALYENNPVDLPMDVLFGKTPTMQKVVNSIDTDTADQQNMTKKHDIDLEEACERVLKLPTVASKKFLITIGDRNVGGLIVQEQMVGKWQTPVSDVAVSATSFDKNTGEAMAIGERAPIALTNAAASARMAVSEAITNSMSASIDTISDITLSANWMAASGYGTEDKNLYDAVQAIGEEFCPDIGITIPVGKDSLSMKTSWGEKTIISPLSVVISAFAPVSDVTGTITPELDTSQDTALIAIDLGRAKSRLAGSSLQQVYSLHFGETPDIDPRDLRDLFESVTKLKKENKILAYHDRSDGGLWATLCEMAFVSRCGLDITVPSGCDEIEFLFNEEIGCVIQVAKTDAEKTIDFLRGELGDCAHAVANIRKDQEIVIKHGEKKLATFKREKAEAWWAETSYAMQKMRDNPSCAEEEYGEIKSDLKGLHASYDFKLLHEIYKTKPQVAIFREQGVNGQVEMAAAFSEAGFSAIDVHLQDIIDGRFDLNDFVGLAACGGFSYGDVLGAGEGWAKTILASNQLRKSFKEFFERENTFTFGVCNGCQMLSALKKLVPGSEHWPEFTKNKSEQFEARLTTVRINDSPSILLKNMEGSYLQVPVAHGEGKATFDDDENIKKAADNSLTAMQYVDNNHKTTTKYPYNPNGSSDGITCLTTTDGRATIMMPHPERAFQVRQQAWHPADESGYSPWFRLFQNARAWVDDNDS